MPKVALFLIDGFEETEALTTVDLLRRGGVAVTTVSLNGEETVTGKHDVRVFADARFETLKVERAQDLPFDMLVIPGGTLAYTEHEPLLKLVRDYDALGRMLAAICAAPAVFGKAGILKGRRAVCYPGLESRLKDAIPGEQGVETDGRITTARGPAFTDRFALRLLELLMGKDVADKVAVDFLVPLARNAD